MSSREGDAGAWKTHADACRTHVDVCEVRDLDLKPFFFSKTINILISIPLKNKKPTSLEPSSCLSPNLVDRAKPVRLQMLQLTCGGQVVYSRLVTNLHNHLDTLRWFNFYFIYTRIVYSLSHVRLQHFSIYTIVYSMFQQSLHLNVKKNFQNSVRHLYKIVFKERYLPT